MVNRERQEYFHELFKVYFIVFVSQLYNPQTIKSLDFIDVYQNLHQRKHPDEKLCFKYFQISFHPISKWFVGVEKEQKRLQKYK